MMGDQIPTRQPGQVAANVLELLPQPARQWLDKVNPRHRDDATGEALLALVEGRDPVRAIRAFVRREQRRERHETPFTDVGIKPDRQVGRGAAGYTAGDVVPPQG